MDQSQCVQSATEKLSTDTFGFGRLLSSRSKALYTAIAVWSILLSYAFPQEINEGFQALEKGNYAEAVRQLLPLAEQGDISAKIAVGSLYIEGKGVPQDYAEGKRWIKRAAAKGDSKAHYMLAKMYRFGIGGPQNFSEALIWYERGASLGEAQLQIMVGLFYLYGINVDKDYTEALRWYRKAAYQGNVRAQLRLANMYELGLGVPEDLVSTHMWFNIAAANGYDFATRGRDRVAERMNAAEISEAQRRARICMGSDYQDCK